MQGLVLVVLRRNKSPILVSHPGKAGKGLKIPQFRYYIQDDTWTKLLHLSQKKGRRLCECV